MYLHRRVAEGAEDIRRGMTPHEFKEDQEAYPTLYRQGLQPPRTEEKGSASDEEEEEEEEEEDRLL